MGEYFISLISKTYGLWTGVLGLAFLATPGWSSDLAGSPSSIKRIIQQTGPHWVEDEEAVLAALLLHLARGAQSGRAAEETDEEHGRSERMGEPGLALALRLMAGGDVEKDSRLSSVNALISQVIREGLPSRTALLARLDAQRGRLGREVWLEWVLRIHAVLHDDLYATDFWVDSALEPGNARGGLIARSQLSGPLALTDAWEPGSSTVAALSLVPDAQVLRTLEVAVRTGSSAAFVGELLSLGSLPRERDWHAAPWQGVVVGPAGPDGDAPRTARRGLQSRIETALRSQPIPVSLCDQSLQWLASGGTRKECGRSDEKIALLFDISGGNAVRVMPLDPAYCRLYLRKDCDGAGTFVIPYDRLLPRLREVLLPPEEASQKNTGNRSVE